MESSWVDLFVQVDFLCFFVVGSGTFEQGKDEMDSSLTVQIHSSYNQWVAPGVPFFVTVKSRKMSVTRRNGTRGSTVKSGYEVVPTDPIFCWSQPLKM